VRNWSVLTDDDARKLANYLKGLPTPFTVTWRDGALRSVSANALLHKWYGEIAKQSGDKTAIEVKGECHVEYGLPIRLRDEAFEWVWSQTGARLSYERKCRLFQRGTFAMTSAMTTKELSEYKNAMARDYRHDGYILSDPEEGKYRAYNEAR